MKINFDCPNCSVFMRGFIDKDKVIKFICPICKSIFLPTQKVIKDKINKAFKS